METQEIKKFDDVKCNRCSSSVYESELEDYTYQCLECDEDLYTIEVYKK